MGTALRAFEDSIKPAHLMLNLFEMLHNSTGPLASSVLMDQMRPIIGCPANELMLLLQNDRFIGLVREHAEVPPARLHPEFLKHLLRQSVVCATTASETFLPGLLRECLKEVIERMGVAYAQRLPQSAADWLKKVQVGPNDLFSILGLPAGQAAERISDIIIGHTKINILGGDRGVETVGSLLSAVDPWKQIAVRLRREPSELRKVYKEAIDRRNDIVHRADRSQAQPTGLQQDISLEWTKQAVGTVDVVIRSLDSLVMASVATATGARGADGGVVAS